MTRIRIAAGWLLILVPLVFAAGFIGLQMAFEYPDILRKPPGEVLTTFAAVGTDVHIYWYLMMAASVGFVPAAIATGMEFWDFGKLAAAFSIGLGMLAGLVQALGLMRWVILIPSFAASYVAPAATDFDKSFAIAAFDLTNRYLGMGVGEHLGYLFTALWTLAIAVLIWRRWMPLAALGIVIALGVAAGMLEPFGFEWAGPVNAIAYSAWALWTLVLGAMVLWRGGAVAAR